MTAVKKFLEGNGVVFRILAHAQPAYTCEDAAILRNVPLSEMLKAILLVDKSGNYVLACIPGDKKLDVQKVRRVINLRRLSFASENEVVEITGFEVGSVPPVALAHKIPILFDSSFKDLGKADISSGIPTMGFQVGIKELVELSGAKFFSITK
ncbi:MAG: YbaK/EbsC family protein [archaeon]|nr:YbaK/EbsC family protein [archaeon]